MNDWLKLPNRIQARVEGSVLMVHDGPNDLCDIIGRLPKNTIVDVYAIESDWTKIKPLTGHVAAMAADGIQEGWVKTTCLSLIEVLG